MSDFAQLGLVDLVQRRAREVPHVVDGTRHFEVRQSLRARGFEVLRERLARCARGTTKATGTSSSLSSGLPTTAASATRPVSRITRSISDAPTFSPPTFTVPLSRP